jgi:UDP-N-acetyl-D-galactosamine dehydrogenase
MIFHKLGIDTTEVLEAAGTKWNFLDFKPGLVGGHCIGVDPYYFIYKAEELGYNSQLISTGRLINDNMGEYIGHEIIKKMNHWDKKIKDSNVLVFGITFKENSKDIRNTKVIDIINTLKEYEVNVFLNDPNANKEDVLREYDIELTEDYTNRKYDSIVIAVNHDIFKDLKLEDLISISNGKTILFDIKGALDKDEALKLGIDYWRL